MAAAWLVRVVKLSRASRAYWTADAVILLTATRRDETLRWSLGEHMTSRVGCGRGVRFRAQIAGPLQAAADAAGAELYGRAANERARDLSLQQFGDAGHLGRVS